MGIDLGQFEKVSQQGEIQTFKQDVDVPQPENTDGTGYTTIKGRQTLYKVFEHVVKVAQVSDNGWSVWHYTEGGDSIGEGSLTRSANAQDAQRLARRKAELLARGEQQ